MAVYEVILRKPRRRDEIRFTDRELRVDGPVLIDGLVSWWITAVQPAAHPLATRRYICEPRKPPG